MGKKEEEEKMWAQKEGDKKERRRFKGEKQENVD